MFHLLMWMVTTMALVCRNEANLMFSAENVLGMWGHLVLGDWTFDNHFIDLFGNNLFIASCCQSWYWSLQ
jgi:hypothetical protein